LVEYFIYLIFLLESLIVLNIDQLVDHNLGYLAQLVIGEDSFFEFIIDFFDDRHSIEKLQDLFLHEKIKKVLFWPFLFSSSINSLDCI